MNDELCVQLKKWYAFELNSKFDQILLNVKLTIE
jgi:hypothetical protein